MSTSTSISLPLEVIELIVDDLAALDRKLLWSIKDFSLVCHALLPRCRKHLFQTISLLYRRRGGQTARAFWELLTRTPELCPHIQTIVYVFDDEPPEEGSIPLVSTQLTQLQSLHLIHDSLNSHFSETVWSTTRHRRLLLPLLHLPTLTHLKLASIHNFSPYDLIPCASLKYLEITSVQFDNQPTYPPITLPNSIMIDRFSMARQRPESLQALLGSHRADGKLVIDLAALKTLTLTFDAGQGLLEVREFIGKTQYLVNVDIQFMTWPSRLDGLYDTLIGSLKTLRYLNCYIPLSDRVIEDPIPGLSHQLEKLRGRNVIERVTISIAADLTSDFDQARADRWGTLDDVLSKVGWPSLKYVSLAIEMTSDPFDMSISSSRRLLALEGTHFTKLVLSPAIHFELRVML